MRTRKEWNIFVLSMVICLAIRIPFALAAEYPTRFIEIIIPFAPGGGTDITARLFKDKVEKNLGQPLVLTYKPGASGMIGATYVKGCKPDGYTLLLIGTTTTIGQSLTKKGDVSLDDLTPICTISKTPFIFCVNQENPYRTMQGFIQAAKTKKMKYATNGVLSGAHIAMEALGEAAGFQATHIPQSTGAIAAMTAVLGGHIDMSVTGPTGMENQLRVLAVGSGTRWEIQKDVPTLLELGYPVKGETHYSLWAPKGTSKEIVNTIYGAHKKALEENREEIYGRAQKGDQILALLGPEELWKIYRADFESYKKIIDKLGLAAK